MKVRMSVAGWLFEEDEDDEDATDRLPAVEMDVAPLVGDLVEWQITRPDGVHAYYTGVVRRRRFAFDRSPVIMTLEVELSDVEGNT